VSRAECDGAFARDAVAAAFATGEIAVDAEALCDAVRARLAREPGVRCRTGTRVLAVDAQGARPIVRFAAGGVIEREAFDHVVNALGEERLAIDATAGYAPEQRWSHRIKHFVRARAPSVAGSIPSATIVLGPFGDIAAYRRGEMYLSWYPTGRRGFSTALVPPAWPLRLDAATARATAITIVERLCAVVPALAALAAAADVEYDLKAGVITAWGDTDIDDPSSGLHVRHAIGPRTRGRYHSVDTGKLTVAPLFAATIGERIRASA
jgi:hypothetical protein